MRKTVGTISLVLGSLGLLIAMRSCFGVESNSSDSEGIFAVGGVLGGCLVAFLFFSAYFIARAGYSENKRASLEMTSKMSHEEFTEFITKELSISLGIKPNQTNKSMAKDLKIPMGEIQTAMENLQIDFNLTLNPLDVSKETSLEELAAIATDLHQPQSS